MYIKFPWKTIHIYDLLHIRGLSRKCVSVCDRDEGTKNIFENRRFLFNIISKSSFNVLHLQVYLNVYTL